MNYDCLGQNDEMRNRRYDVLTLMLKGAKPTEICKITNLTIKQVYNDIHFLTHTRLHDIPIELVRDNGLSFYETKIRELESRAEKYKDVNHNAWLGMQKLIKEYKDSLLKLAGATNENTEITINGPVQIEWIRKKE